MLISVVLPTIKGREARFEQTREAYLRDSGYPVPIELIIERDHPTVGCAWQAGAERAVGDYIHLGNDDCEPRPGWWQPAIEACDQGMIPSPMVVNAATGMPEAMPLWGLIAPDWTQVSCAIIPFVSRAQWEAVRPLFLGHYYADNFLTIRAKWAGWPCVLRHGYAFTHHWAMEGRGAGMGTQEAREVYDERLFYRAMGMVAAGEWNKPWPEGGRA